MRFLIYDLIFFAIFTLLVLVFLYNRRKKLQREGILFLYRTKLGIKFIEYAGEKWKKALNFIQYISITFGYIFMIGITYLAGYTLYTYATKPEIRNMFKAPPIIPLIPYFPKIFGLESIFPDFYFTYFILSILIVAVVHEFAHGIFAKAKGLKIKSTGFAFIGPLIGAFVEPDEKKMFKKSKRDQLAILSAGVFANLITAGIFFLIMVLFFSISFAPLGIMFSYASKTITPNEITSIGESVVLFEKNFTKIKTDKDFLVLTENLENEIIIAFEDSPAINSELRGVIIKVGDAETKNYESLSEELAKYKPGEKVKITAFFEENEEEEEIVLAENPNGNGKGYLGIGVAGGGEGGVFSKYIRKTMNLFKEPGVFYAAKANPDLSSFIYYLFWWIIIINLLVAVFNMLPVGIFDGGRFFFLTVAWMTGSEKIAKKISGVLAKIFLIILLLLLFIWLSSFAA